MAKVVNMKEVVKHLINGTINENLCRICLLPFNTISEDMFTKVCKNGKDYCIADILERICDIKIFEEDKFRICSECFIAASAAYKFYLLTKRSEEILHFYVSLLEQHIDLIDLSHQIPLDSFCITLESFKPETEIFDYDLTAIVTENIMKYDDVDSSDKTSKTPDHVPPEDDQDMFETEDSSDIVIISYDNGEPTFYKEKNGSFVPVDDNGKREMSKIFKKSLVKNKRVQRRRRNPMSYVMCSKCPVRYKFVTKLKEHMKIEHNIDLFVCSVCKVIIEDEDEYNKHLSTHSNIHKCAKCNMVFRNRENIITHLKWHDTIENANGAEMAHICEVCGLVLMDEEQLKDHNNKKHVKKYTCYYCGRMYKLESSFEIHIRKHEMHLRGETKTGKETERQKNTGDESEREATKKKKFICGTCGRECVDERSLMWHQRLHTNERPYICDVCGRGFVSLNRRNQHAVCAHTAPARRCPLCPALFHLRSMVNTHVKKVHLKEHKRRNRATKHQNVFWRTEPVPIQELSVTIQSEILELQAAQQNNAGGNKW